MSAVDRIVRKLNFMQVPVNYLKSIDPENINLEENYEVRSAIERNFQLAIEGAIDIGEIIISKEGFERPEDYRSVFLILGKQGVLPKTLQKNSQLQQVSEIFWFIYMKRLTWT